MSISILKKQCTKCGRLKPVDEFYRDAQKSDGFCSSCKACQKEYLATTLKKRRETFRAWRQRNREKIRAYVRDYPRKNPEFRQRRNQYKETWRKVTNRDRHLEWSRNYERHRRSSNPSYRIVVNLSRNLRQALTWKGKVKDLTTMRIVGCSKLELMEHLQRQFKLGMNWNNYGKVWEIDHIKPTSLFNLVEEAQQKACFHYTNLQPLFKLENRQKSNKCTV